MTTLRKNGEWGFRSPARSAIRIEPRLLTDSVDAAIDAALDGLGITRVLSHQVTEHVAAGRLTPLDDQAPAPLPVSLLYHANRQRSPNVRAMIDATRDCLRKVRLD